jgi:hypothetical protein
MLLCLIYGGIGMAKSAEDYLSKGIGATTLGLTQRVGGFLLHAIQLIPTAFSYPMSLFDRKKSPNGEYFPNMLLKEHFTRMFMNPAADREALASGFHEFLKDRLKPTEVLPQAENPFDKGNLLYVHHERKDKGWDGITASSDSEYFGLSHSVYKLFLKVPEYRGPELDGFELIAQRESIREQVLKISSLLGGGNEIHSVQNDFNYGSSDISIIYSSESKFTSGDKRVALKQMDEIQSRLPEIQKELNALARLVKGQDLCEKVTRLREEASAAMRDHETHELSDLHDPSKRKPKAASLA